MKALHKNSERNERIYEQRKLGRTLKSIGDEFGLSSERIRGLCVRHERLKINIKRGGVFLLSSRAQNVIRNLSNDDDFEWSYENLIKVGNCGSKTIKEVLEYIEGLEEANESAN